MHSIADARLELEDLLAGGMQKGVDINQPAVTRRTAIAALSGAAAGAAATSVFAISRYRGAAPRKLTQFAMMAPDSGLFVPSFNNRVAISPDGTRIAFNAGLGGAAAQAFYLRSFAELESKRVKDVLSGGAPFFSPDGRWVGFITNSAPFVIGKIALSGGAPITICPHDAFAGATWADGDIIYWVDDNPGGLTSVAVAGGQPKEVGKVDFAKGERQHKFPCALPGGKRCCSR